MAKPNYQYEKRQRDLAKKQKQEEKRRQKLASKHTPEGGDDSSPADAENEVDSTTPDGDASPTGS